MTGIIGPHVDLSADNNITTSTLSGSITTTQVTVRDHETDAAYVEVENTQYDDPDREYSALHQFDVSGSQDDNVLLPTVVFLRRIR